MNSQAVRGVQARRRDAAFDSGQLTVIEPPGRWLMVDLRELWAYRELAWVLTVRDIKVRYKQTVLGAAWALIQPVTSMLIFSVLLGKFAGIPSDGHPYPLFVYAGLLPWMLFANAITSIGNSVVGSAQLVSKVYFPRLIIPLSSVGAIIVDFVISLAVLLVLMVYYGSAFSMRLAIAPVVVLGILVVSLGVGTLLAALTAAYRDFRYVIPFLLQVWLYCSPVVYPISAVPDGWRWAFYLNPMTGLIDGFRFAVLGTGYESVGRGSALPIAAVLLLLGVSYFQSVQRKFADII
jgi:lipopolysaccharide transport system permease protein